MTDRGVGRRRLAILRHEILRSLYYAVGGGVPRNSYIQKQVLLRHKSVLFRSYVHGKQYHSTIYVKQRLLLPKAGTFAALKKRLFARCVLRHKSLF